VAVPLGSIAHDTRARRKDLSGAGNKERAEEADLQNYWHSRLKRGLRSQKQEIAVRKTFLEIWAPVPRGPRRVPWGRWGVGQFHIWSGLFSHCWEDIGQY